MAIEASWITLALSISHCKADVGIGLRDPEEGFFGFGRGFGGNPLVLVLTNFLGYPSIELLGRFTAWPLLIDFLLEDGLSVSEPDCEPLLPSDWNISSIRFFDVGFWGKECSAHIALCFISLSFAN
jgi:hypothetical protein